MKLTEQKTKKCGWRIGLQRSKRLDRPEKAAARFDEGVLSKREKEAVEDVG